jgi:hypothetical protein
VQLAARIIRSAKRKLRKSDATSKSCRTIITRLRHLPLPHAHIRPKVITRFILQLHLLNQLSRALMTRRRLCGELV